jgi:pimeloyl-ACP methyl ester carboxylesterase
MTIARRLLSITLVLAAMASDTHAQEKVFFTTTDGVELGGVYYQGPKKKPVVLLLHALGEDCQKKPYQDLAESLKKEYSVLTFDFRGHGQSKTIDPAKFAKFAKNQEAKVPANSTTIEYAKFDKRYLPVLCNDIAAARAYLERNKNDGEDCNVSNIILIGCDTGASLGAIWLNSEWYRFRFNPPTPLLPGGVETVSEGKDISAAIWLSINPTLGAWKLRLSSQLDLPMRNGVPMVFMFGEGDAAGKRLATDVVSYWKKSKDLAAQLKATVAYEVKGANKLSGSGLLVPSLGTDKLILDYLGETTRRGGEWKNREFRKTLFVWRNGNQLTAAKVVRGAFLFPFPVTQEPDETNLFFTTYQEFIR